MRKVLILVAILVLSGIYSITVLGQENIVEKIKIEKISEKKFNKNIKDVVFSRDKENNIYPKVLIDEESIEFLDEKGEIKKEKRIQKLKGRGWIKKSKNGKVFGIWEALEIDPNKDYATKSRFTLLDSEGNLLWEKENFKCGMISDDRETVVDVQDTLMGNGLITFYNNLISKVVKPTNEFAGVNATFSDDGKYFVLLTNVPPLLVFYNSIGEQLWKKNLNADRARLVVTSSQADFIAFTKYKNLVPITECYDRNGNKIWEKENYVVNEASKFSLDGGYIVLLSVDKKIILVETKSGENIWTFDCNYNESLKKYSTVISIDISANGKLTAISIGIHPYYLSDKNLDLSNKPRKVFLIDKQGNIVWEHLVNSNVTINVLEDKIFIKMDKEIHQYKINK